MVGNDLTRGNVSKTLLRFAVPFLVANVLHTLYGLVDMFIVGQFCDASQLSSVSIGAGIMNLANCLVTGLGVGGMIALGQMIGARRERDSQETISTIFCVVPAFAVLLLVVCMILRRQLLNAMSTPPEAYAGAESYLRICLFGLVFTGLFSSISGVLRGMGDSKGPTIFISIACLCNILGDYICVGTLKLGAAGAALATVLSQGISVLAGYIYLRRHNFPFDFHPRSFRFFFDKFKILMRVGIPSALQDGLTNISFLMMESIINAMGYAASAAAGISNRIFNISITPATAFASAISAMVAQNVGAREFKRARKSLRVGLTFGFIIAAVFFAIMALFPAQLVRSFTDDEAVIRAGTDYLTFYKFDSLICSMAFCVNGYISGTGHTRYTMIVNLAASFGVRLPVVWLISRMAGATLYHIGLGIPSASVVQLCLGIGFLLFAKSERENRKQESLRI